MQLRQNGRVVTVGFLLVLIEALRCSERFCQRRIRLRIEAFWTSRKRLIEIFGAQLAVIDRIVPRFQLGVRRGVSLIAHDARFQILFQAQTASGQPRLANCAANQPPRRLHREHPQFQVVAFLDRGIEHRPERLLQRAQQLDAGRQNRKTFNPQVRFRKPARQPKILAVLGQSLACQSDHRSIVCLLLLG